MAKVPKLKPHSFHNDVTSNDARLIAAVYEHYRVSGRHDLPWRGTRDPYHILVSEVMLQQTQVERVIPKYEAFLARFPTLAALADAPLKDVLVLWQGLGYNRRAKMLQACAVSVMHDYGGVMPKDEVTLRQLPGVGPYTAAAVAAFAYGIPVTLIETNVRTVYIHHYYPDATDITDRELLPHITRTLDYHQPRHWYYALMDYGSHLKRTVGNNISRSRHYTKQSTFKGSDRQIRGAIIRALTTSGTVSRQKLMAMLTFDELRIDAQLVRLEEEGLIVKTGRSYRLPT